MASDPHPSGPRPTRGGGELRDAAWTAIGARLGFVAAMLLVLYGLYFGGVRVFASTHVQHFAGFYALSLATAGAFKRSKVISLGYAMALTALALEGARLTLGRPWSSTYFDWLGDAAGVIGAFGPMLLQKIRSDFATDPPRA